MNKGRYFLSLRFIEEDDDESGAKKAEIYTALPWAVDTTRQVSEPEHRVERLDGYFSSGCHFF